MIWLHYIVSHESEISLPFNIWLFFHYLFFFRFIFLWEKYLRVAETSYDTWWILWNNFTLKVVNGTSLVVQWLRIRLPMQRTQVRSLVQEDPTCWRIFKPKHLLKNTLCAAMTRESQWETARTQHGQKLIRLKNFKWLLK